MEDFILREIDRIGELLLGIARKLGLFKGDIPDYTLVDVQAEFEKAQLNIDLDTAIRQKFPISYLVEEMKVSDKALETLVDIIYHSDIDKKEKDTILNDALTYLDNRGYISFRLHSYIQ